MFLSKLFVIQNYELIKLDKACKLPAPVLINAQHCIPCTSKTNTGPVTELLFVFKNILLLQPF